jgi:hypothetical protein
MQFTKIGAFLFLGLVAGQVAGCGGGNTGSTTTQTTNSTADTVSTTHTYKNLRYTLTTRAVHPSTEGLTATLTVQNTGSEPYTFFGGGCKNNVATLYALRNSSVVADNINRGGSGCGGIDRTIAPGGTYTFPYAVRSTPLFPATIAPGTYTIKADLDWVANPTEEKPSVSVDELDPLTVSVQ